MSIAELALATSAVITWIGVIVAVITTVRRHNREAATIIAKQGDLIQRSMTENERRSLRQIQGGKPYVEPHEHGVRPVAVVPFAHDAPVAWICPECDAVVPEPEPLGPVFEGRYSRGGLIAETISGNKIETGAIQTLYALGDAQTLKSLEERAAHLERHITGDLSHGIFSCCLSGGQTFNDLLVDVQKQIAARKIDTAPAPTAIQRRTGYRPGQPPPPRLSRIAQIGEARDGWRRDGEGAWTQVEAPTPTRVGDKQNFNLVEEVITTWDGSIIRKAVRLEPADG